METNESNGIYAVQIKILQNAAATICLAGVTGKVLLNYENVDIRILLLDFNSAGKATDTAAENKSIAINLVIFFHVLHLTYTVQKTA